jgi:hypothetical protein
MRGIVLCKSCDVKIVQNAGSVLNTTGKETEGVGWMMGYLYLSSCDFSVQHVR